MANLCPLYGSCSLCLRRHNSVVNSSKNVIKSNLCNVNELSFDSISFTLTNITATWIGGEYSIELKGIIVEEIVAPPLECPHQVCSSPYS